MTSFGKLGIENISRKWEKEEQKKDVPIFPTKPHPDMIGRFYLDRELEVCGKSGCKRPVVVKRVAPFLAATSISGNHSRYLGES